MHLDPVPWPCTYRGWDAGCFIMRSDGSKHIYLSSLYPWSVRRHEEGHVDGMWHTEWDSKGCTTVVAGDSTQRYKAGDVLCVHKHGEQIIRQ